MLALYAALAGLSCGICVGWAVAAEIAFYRRIALEKKLAALEAERDEAVGAMATVRGMRQADWRARLEAARLLPNVMGDPPDEDDEESLARVTLEVGGESA